MNAECGCSINMGILEIMAQLWNGECGVGKESNVGDER